MRILMLNWRCLTNPKSGGAEYVTRKHLEAWALAGHEVHWLAGGYPGAKPYEKLDISPKTREQMGASFPREGGSTDEVGTEGVSSSTLDFRPSTQSPIIHLHRFGSPLTISFLAPLLYWFKWHGDFDLVIDQIHGIPFLTPLWAWRSRKIAFIHEVAQEIWDEMLPWPINIIGRMYEKVLFSIFYRQVPFWTVSESTKKDLVTYGVAPDNIQVIPNAIDLETVTKVPEKEKTLTFIFLARLVKMKGIEDALRIIAEVKKTTPEVKLWVVGGGDPSYVSHLQDMTKELCIEANVEFKGRVDEDEKVRLLRRAHWLLHTSVREGFGLTALEAVTQYCPVICYDVPGLRDIIHDGVNGLVMTRNTKITLAHRLKLYFDHPTRYTELLESTIHSVDSYDWAKICPASLHLLLSIRSPRDDAVPLHFFIGTSAEFIKVFPVIKQCQKRHLPFKIIASGQNDISQSDLFPHLQIQQPDITLYVGSIRQTPLGLLAWFVKALGNGLLAMARIARSTTRTHRYMVVHGDTVSTLLGAILGTLFGFRIVHIESGLRSFDYMNPFPEEIDRVIVSRLASVHFPPNDWAAKHLAGVHGHVIVTKGNTLYDSLQYTRKLPTIHRECQPKNEKYCIFVIHRQENLYQLPFLQTLVSQIIEVSRSIHVVFVMHPPTEAALKKAFLFTKLSSNENITISRRVPYNEFMLLLKESEYIITDGGSNQEEAYFLGVPCLILRSVTERNEGIGLNALMSRRDPHIIADFTHTYMQYRTQPPVFDKSPSDIIVDYFQQHIYV